MKIKPIVMQEINTTHTSFIVDLHLDYNVTFITGDSGVGKSALYSFMKNCLQMIKEYDVLIILTRKRITKLQ